jgi:ferrous iron transport protein A
VPKNHEYSLDFSLQLRIVRIKGTMTHGSDNPVTLRDLTKNEKAVVCGFNMADEDLVTRLREIGFAEGDPVEALHFGLFFKNPMTVRLNGALIAMRSNEARCVYVSKGDEGETHA